jgi:putative SOS response-associated peptidase YedK
MCGRFFLVIQEQQLWMEQFGVESGHLDIVPRYNIAPTQQVPVVRNDGSQNNLSMMRWGLLPAWAPAPARQESRGQAKARPEAHGLPLGPGRRASGNTRYAMINAREDKILETRSYVGPFKSRRCLIPASGFFEWRKGTGKARQPVLARLKTGEPFALAGIWEVWRDRGNPGAEDVLSCSIITTAANALMEPIHDRMPVILSPDLYQDWMDPGNEDVGGLKEMLLPYDAGLMETFPVSSRVNSVRNDGPDLVLPLSELPEGGSDSLPGAVPPPRQLSF